MLASSATIRVSGSDQTRGITTRMISARPGPTCFTSDSMVNGPPETLKYNTKTSGSVVSERRSLMSASTLEARSSLLGSRRGGRRGQGGLASPTSGISSGYAPRRRAATRSERNHFLAGVRKQVHGYREAAGKEVDH